MRVKVIDYRDNWQAVKNAALNTIGKNNGKYPSPEWKRKILLAEHSPIRLLEFTIRIEDIPSWVSVHLVRHKIGVEHFVKTQRTDRTGIDRNNLPQSNPVTHTMRINAQALIAISRKRLCTQASKETREVWREVIDAIAQYEPEIASVCVPECVYRGFCPEMQKCGYSASDTGREARIEYVEGNGVLNPYKSSECVKRDLETIRKAGVRCCGTCHYYRIWNGVCVNGSSDYVADFVSLDFECEHWEEMKNA